jgi:LysR family transcriptional regulator, benzoate and cis,cis-muconate-responsive activator of ben and cat genes
MIEVKPLYYFVAAYEEGSVTAAASRCFIAQPSITHAIKSLETRLGATLFERSKQGIKPTSEGKKLYKLAVDFLLQNQQIESAFMPDNRVEISIYIQSDINIERYQEIFDLLRGSSSFIDLVIVNQIEQAQLAIIDEDSVPAQFQFKLLSQEEYKLVVKPDHPLTKQKVVTLNDFEALTFIARPYCTNQKAFERLINENKITITYKGKAIHDLQVQALVKLGVGVALIPESYIQQESGLKYLSISFKVPIKLSTALAYRHLPKEMMETIKRIGRLY